MRHLPLTLARISALGVVALTPWLYGGTLPWVIEAVSQGLLGATALALLGWICAWRLPRLGWLLPFSFILLGLGWLSAWYPRSRFDDMLMLLFPLEGAATLGDWFQGTVDQDRSLRAMQRISGLIGLLAIVRDMAAESRWRRVILWMIALTGTGVALHGLIQKSTGDLWGYWQVKKMSPFAFAGFWYHANAAAFLNLCWPFTAALCVESFARKWNQLLRALLLLALLTLLTATLVNVSKAGHVLAGIQALLFTFLALPSFLRTVTGHEKVKKAVLLTAVIVTCGGVGIATFFGTDLAERRWEEMTMDRALGGDSRFQCMRFCAQEIPKAGWQGYGPGTFEAVFLDAGTTHPSRVPKHRWRFAHQDTLQILMEWGWIAGTGWIALGFGFLIQSWRRLVKLRQSVFSSRYTLQAAAVTALTGVALHAQADFPLQILGIQVVAVTVTGLACQRELRK